MLKTGIGGASRQIAESKVDNLKLPLNELAELSFRKLKQSFTLERAYKSSVYFKKWSKAEIEPHRINSYSDFSKIPYLTSSELRGSLYNEKIEDVLCSEVKVWFSSTGTTGTPKWIPYGKSDIELFMKTRDRIYDLLPSLDKIRALAVSTPSPYIEDGLVALNFIRGLERENSIESVAFSVTEAKNEQLLDFALDLKPNVIVGVPSFIARFAEVVEERAPEVAKKQFYKRKNFTNLFKYFITRVKKIRPKDLSNFQWGLFGGEPLDPYREVIKRSFGLEPFEIYLFTEFMPPAIECRAHNGMHLWLDISLPEIIPEEELKKERQDRTYTPKAIPLWKAKNGQRGEYVLTTFGEALPLVRYRFGDLIEVTSVDCCSCGCTHPKIKVPRRCDPNTICLGLIRFSTLTLEEKILEENAFSKVKTWQAEICRDGYRPKLVVYIQPEGEIQDLKSYISYISGKLVEIEVLRVGIENKIVAAPEIVVGSISIKGCRAGLRGRVFYAGEDEEATC